MPALLTASAMMPERATIAQKCKVVSALAVHLAAHDRARYCRRPRDGTSPRLPQPRL